MRPLKVLLAFFAAAAFASCIDAEVAGRATATPTVDAAADALALKLTPFEVYTASPRPDEGPSAAGGP